MNNQQQTIGKNKSSGEEKVERLATEKAVAAEKSQAKKPTQKTLKIAQAAEKAKRPPNRTQKKAAEKPIKRRIKSNRKKPPRKNALNLL